MAYAFNSVKDYKYLIIINTRDYFYVDYDKEAWDVIGQQSFGSTRIVYDTCGRVVEQFIPF